MTALLPQLNCDLGDLAARVRESLVQVVVSSEGSGSGVVLSTDGLVVTNAHVVEANKYGRSARAFKVVLPSGQVTSARLLAKDKSLDVAVLKVDSYKGDMPELQPIGIGDSKALCVGQWVMAMGNPWGVAGVAVAGIVIGVGTGLPEAIGEGREWVVVDLALRPGHSGGPLVDHQGQMIGMSTMMAGLEVGMAVPAHVIWEFVARVHGGDSGMERDNSALA